MIKPIISVIRINAFLTDKGKPVEKLGRKAMDLRLYMSYDRQATEGRGFIFLHTGMNQQSHKKGLK